MERSGKKKRQDKSKRGSGGSPREAVSYWRSATLTGIECVKARYVGFRFKRHFHLDYSLGIIEEGAQGFNWRGVGYDVGGVSRIITFNPGEVHDGRSLTDPGYRLRVLTIDGQRVERFIQGLEKKGYRQPAFRGPVLRAPALASRLLFLHRYLERGPDRSSPLLEASLMDAFLAGLFQCHGEVSLPPCPHRLSDKRVRKVQEYLHAHLHRKITLEDLSELTDLSPYYFLRMFKNAVGMPPHAYLTRLRLERSKKMLMDAAPVSDVALRAGFCDQSHFSRNFKGAYGVTPGEYLEGLWR